MKSNATPCFPQFAAKVAAMGKRAVAPLSSLIDVEAQFSRFLPKRGPEFPERGRSYKLIKRIDGAGVDVV